MSKDTIHIDHTGRLTLREMGWHKMLYSFALVYASTNAIYFKLI